MVSLSLSLLFLLHKLLTSLSTVPYNHSLGVRKCSCGLPENNIENTSVNVNANCLQEAILDYFVCMEYKSIQNDYRAADSVALNALAG